MMNDKDKVELLINDIIALEFHIMAITNRAKFFVERQQVLDKVQYGILLPKEKRITQRMF